LAEATATIESTREAVKAKRGSNIHKSKEMFNSPNILSNMQIDIFTSVQQTLLAG